MELNWRRWRSARHAEAPRLFMRASTVAHLAPCDLPATADVQVLFNQLIAEAVWAASLRQLCIEGDFKQPIAGVGWSAPLLGLSFEGHFD